MRQHVTTCLQLNLCFCFRTLFFMDVIMVNIIVFFHLGVTECCTTDVCRLIGIVQTNRGGAATTIF